MPKLVDPVERREHIVRAVLRLVAREGFAGASLRNVAAESGLNIGSVRHYFTSHTELVLFAMTSMVERVSARLLGHVEAAAHWERRPLAARRATVQAALEELLPLDEDRHAEVAVFVEFAAAARTDPALAAAARKAAAGTRGFVARLTERYVTTDGMRPGLDPAVEAARLWALLDGVATQAVLQPQLVTAETCRQVLDTHLRSLEATRGT
ncbi:TetR family transcriptional regulator C-terminal domain-containing protein [Isoptericola sp. NEAU-Y5]|uniref:TetR family transcriptional regulator C-terminal domain-containing protein n=1 Tax=Isoptericola luteus TaxID=2879484 RepID=A0ABS7ZN48_9MICO|nr:TetR family transcriptional regulator C-terminal domain-containing protein [Isoptericola sp. NEAU-Y5]MCA5895190.1 TetR family transcriptional regulator C-terminal domain-containing protein [Isoptericola sp. NEAU-Y5]